jgi:hypothetical protein
MDFQHSQPQSVYRIKNRHFLWLMVAAALTLTGLYAYRTLSRPSALAVVPIPLWLWLAYQAGRQLIRSRLVISPAGLSITFIHSAWTPWSNVERLQTLWPGSQNQMRVLVLRNPIETRLWVRHQDVPKELKGRVIPLAAAVWERIDELEQELYRYLPASQEAQLSVPHTFAVASQSRPERQILAALVIVLGAAVLWLLRGVLW